MMPDYEINPAYDLAAVRKQWEAEKNYETVGDLLVVAWNCWCNHLLGDGEFALIMREASDWLIQKSRV